MNRKELAQKAVFAMEGAAQKKAGRAPPRR